MQSTLLPELRLFGARVDLVLLLVALWSSLRSLDEAILWGLLGGFFSDVLSAGPFGTQMLTLGVVAVLAGTIGATLNRLHPLFLVGLPALLTVVADLLLTLVLGSQGWPLDVPGTVALVILPGCLLNTLAAPFVYLYLRVANSWFQPRTWLG